MIKFLVGVYFGAGITWCLLMLSKSVREGAHSDESPSSLPSSRTACLQHGSPMTHGELCDHAKQMAAEGRYAGGMCVAARVPFHPFRIQ